MLLRIFSDFKPILNKSTQYKTYRTIYKRIDWFYQIKNVSYMSKHPILLMYKFNCYN